MNEGWRDEYEGHLELWDMEANARICRIAPLMNRCVIFATNEVSYHGHPTPLACPEDVKRRSVAIYYYSETRDDVVGSVEHNTIYRQTTGAGGYAKTALSSAVAVAERVRSDGVVKLGATLLDKAVRRARGLPPRNG